MRKLPLAILQFCILCALSSCGLYGRYTPAHPEADSITTPAYTEVFTDPALQSLVERALVRNLDLKAAHERVNQANATLLGSKLAYIPSVNAAVSGGMQSVGGTTTTPWQAGAQIDWTFDLFGRMYNNMKMARASALSAEDTEQLYRAELIGSVATNYYRLLALDAQIIVADSIGALYREQVDALRAMKEAGMSDEAAVAQYEGNMYQLHARARALRLTRHEVENAIRLLLSEPEYGEIRRHTLAESSRSAALDSVPMSAVLTRPDVRRAEHALEHAFYGVQLSRANCCPNISLSGFVGYGGGFLWNATTTLLQPLFNSGRNIAAVRSAKSAQQEAVYAYQSALVTASLDVNNALAATDSYRAQAEDMLLRQQAFERAYDATSTKFRLGQGSYLESLIALQQLLDARMDLIDTYTQILLSHVELYLALGGGR